jgi:hypothetical protein
VLEDPEIHNNMFLSRCLLLLFDTLSLKLKNS